VLRQANYDMQKHQFNTVASAAMKILNVLEKAPSDEGLSILLRLLSPITPHVCHYLWRELGFGSDVMVAPWPEPDPAALEQDEVELVVQVNGKLRGSIKGRRPPTSPPSKAPHERQRAEIHRRSEREERVGARPPGEPCHLARSCRGPRAASRLRLKMRGSADVLFDALHPAAEERIGLDLKRTIEAHQRESVDDLRKADAIMQISQESRSNRSRRSPAPGASRIPAQLHGRVPHPRRQGRRRVPSNTIQLARDLTYNDAQILAKEWEEQLLFRDMETQAVQQILRRLSGATPPQPRVP
jgi:hypothetical protein